MTPATGATRAMRAMRAMRALLHPVAVGSLALWLLNDHWLKSVWPGLITGKLSDITGMIVTPLVLMALVERAVRPFNNIAMSPRFMTFVRWLCAIIVAAAFTAVKTSIEANAIYCTVAAALRLPLRLALSSMHGMDWSDRIVLVRDPTDLIAVPFAYVAIWLTATPVAAATPLMEARERSGAS